MTASSAPTSTVSSSSALISRSVPATGEGISVSTLSVETSRSASSTATSSPTCLSQRVTVPSVTDSPRAGRVTDVVLPPPDDSPPDDFSAAAGCSCSAAGCSGSSDCSASPSSASASAWVSPSSDAASDSSADSPDGSSPVDSPPPLDSPSSPITARIAPISTVSSSAALISSSVPATGDGISVSTLSVETSSSASSTETVSPTCLSQRVTVPSVTDSPSAGRVTSVAMRLLRGDGSVGGGFRSGRATASRRGPGGPRRVLRSGWGARARAARRPRRTPPSRRSAGPRR